MSDLSICQQCGTNPAVYGDGITWSRCGLCQLNKVKENGEAEPTQEGPVNPDDSFPHEIVPGLVSVIIPVHMNSYTLFHYTGNCIGALREHTPEDAFELVVVDNGSPIQPPSPNSYYADRLVKNEENLGFTKAVNQGIRVSVGEYIVLLNNDVQVFDGWLEDMKADIDAGSDLVMAHPMYSLTEPFARAKESAAVRSGKKKLDPLERDFSCVMFKRSLIDEIGLFDEQFISYCSDSDFLRRMEGRGKKIKMLNHVATSHISDATGYSLPDTSVIMDNDKALFAAKWDSNQVAEQPPELEQEDRQKPGNVYRTPETGDAIYYIVNGKYHHVKDPQTLEALGLKFGDEELVSMKDLCKLGKYGEEISMKNVSLYAKI